MTLRSQPLHQPRGTPWVPRRGTTRWFPGLARPRAQRGRARRGRRDRSRASFRGRNTKHSCCHRSGPVLQRRHSSPA